MEWINYHHLLYFWTIAKQGSIAKACQELRLAQPTLSGQLRALEESMGEKLFQRAGRRLILTEVGRVVYRYADEIFTIGDELKDVLKGRPRGRAVPLLAGVTDAIPKLIAYRILQPALAAPGGVRLVCHEDDPDRLFANLSAHELDIVLANAPASGAVGVRVFNHLLGASGMALYGSPKLAARYRKGFPQSLEGAPFLLPMENSPSRRGITEWFDSNSIQPSIAGEFKDSALMSVFGGAGTGLFAAPVAIESEVKRYYRVDRVGVMNGVVEQYYAVSAERKIKHPAVAAISQSARLELFAAMR